MKSLICLSIFVTVVSAATLSPIEPIQLEGRITNGEIARRGQFPYQVGLSIAVGNKSAWCGGTIISDRWVLTAAHCTLGVDGVTIYYGAFDIQNHTEVGQQRIYSSKKNIFVHKDYNPLSIMQHDISLIKSPLPIEFNKIIQPATLPKQSQNYSSYEGEMVIASGWGKERDNSTSTSQHLRYIEAPVMKLSACNRYYFNTVTNNMICIKSVNKKSICNGDSGGPLVYRDNGVNYIIGATSFGIKLGCEKGWPGVFTRVTSYLDWIEEISGVSNK